ncbi:MAG: SUMF1/EgtB/PvdO family nonheme iron enzyme [Verrucomicrobiales bacterium]|nr:SUMF1/EgtB/PvdO family nonheme iron enzyme [Verrucomicrobiales bacterium]
MARSVTGMLRAVKVVQRKDFDLERTYEREFEGIKKYENVSKDHPALVDVLHVGRNKEKGFYFYVMELGDDQFHGQEIDPESYEPRTLASDLRARQNTDVQVGVTMGIRIAGALGHLHQKGLTHRDVKPSNVIFVNGEAKLADIGLVAHSGQRSYVGTEGYMPPEGPGTASGDLYSLAMVLYEVATGKDRLDFPELPTNLELSPTVNRDEWRMLNAVICRAGAPNARKRYASAETLVVALQAIQEQEEKSEERWLGRAWMAAAVVVFLMLGGIGAFVYYSIPPGSSPPLELSGDNKDEDGGDEDGIRQSLVLNSGGTPVIRDSFFPEVGDLSAPVFPRDMTLPKGGQKMGKDADSDKGGETDEADKVEPVVEMAEFKVFSHPIGAQVWHDDKELGRTPTRFLSFPPGRVELVLRLTGYQDKIITRELVVGRQYDNATLIRDRRPIENSPWVNSLDIRYQPGDGTHVSGEITRDQFATFLEKTQRPFAVAGKDGLVLASEKDQWAFCDWMTAEDQMHGFLGERQYHRPQISGTPGREGTFFCVIDDVFGGAVVSSDPVGARVYRGGRLIGRTPLPLREVRAGPFSVTLKKEGHGDELRSGWIKTGRELQVEADLERDGSVIFGQPWSNSLAMAFVPVGNSLMVSTYETRVRDFDAYLQEVMPVGGKPPAGFTQDLDHPVVGVSLHDAQNFCAWLTDRERVAGKIESNEEYRLPTDLEWSEMAGLKDEKGVSPERRDSKVRKHFPWGEQWPPPTDSGNFADKNAKGRYVLKNYDDGFAKTAPVGQYKANDLGIYDLAGNVWEWVSDAYSGDTGLQVVRGGAWNVSERDLLLTSYRNAVPPTIREGLYGFRCVLAKVKAGAGQATVSVSQQEN